MIFKTGGSDVFILLVLFTMMLEIASAWMYELSSLRKSDMKQNCPTVRAMKSFDLPQMLGYWYVVQYYASSEEIPEYACMRSLFSISEPNHHVTMNFMYIYAEEPLRQQLKGNITWVIPNYNVPAHWIHSEDIYEGIYNTYVIDTDYNSWALLMHCAEKSKSPRYLSALLLSRESTLAMNVVNFLKEKLLRYDIDLSFMFSINQADCDNLASESNLNSYSSYSLFEINEEGINKKNSMKIIPKSLN